MAGQDTLRGLMNAAWQSSPVCEDATYKGAISVRVEFLEAHASDLEIDVSETRAIGLLADFDDEMVGDALVVAGSSWIITAARPTANQRVELILQRT